ncbi:MAG: hypothetical protein IBX45_03905 [Campylobacterales bacterium]|nr:hypothetical protein [Campylobacterales bacterium]
MPASTHVFKETFAFLEQHIDESFYCESFDGALTKALYTTLSYHFSDEEIFENRTQIRKAFKSYFLLLNQKISLFFRGSETIVLKDLKKHVFKEHSQQFHENSKLLTPLFAQLDRYRVKEGVYMIPRETLIAHGCDYENIEDEAIKKELYRETAKVAFYLEVRDLVFFMNEKLTIKKFASSQEGNPSERRAYGLPPEELEKLKTMVFEQSILNEIQSGIDLLLSTKLNFAVISNEYFRKNAIPFVQNILYQVASMYMGEDSHIALKNAFVNYIFREHFYSIHELFSQKLLGLHALREKNAENFLRFYDGNIEVIEGRQAQKPEIIDEKGQKWNAVSILPIVIQKMRCDKENETLQERVEKAQAKYDEANEKLLVLTQETEVVRQKKEELDEAIKRTITQSKELQDKNYELKRLRNQGQADEAMQKEIGELAIEIKQYSKEEEVLRTSIRETNNALEAARIKTKNLNTEIQSLERYINDHHRKLDNLLQMYAPIMEKYDLIIDAVAKTLMAKY